MTTDILTLQASAPYFVGDGAIEMRERVWSAPRDRQLLIRVRANAICGTDRAQYFNGSTVTAGHEAAGEVYAAGPNTKTPVGTRGVVYFKDYCGICRSCSEGHTSLCTQKRTSTGLDSDGGYGPYELISETQFFPITDDLPFPLATMLLDALGTTGHAVSRALTARPNMTSVYIAGAGPIGLGLLVMCKIRLPADVPVYVSDLSEWRLQLAERLGAIPIDASNDSNIQAIAPVDVAFDGTGKRVARQLCLDTLGNNGIFMVVGGQEGFEIKDVGIDMLPRELSILGSEYFDFDEFQENYRLLRENRELIEQLVTHTFPVSQLHEAFEAFLSGETGKVVVTQDGDPQ